MYLTEHFSLEELTGSQTAARKGIDNTLPADLLPNLQRLAEMLELIRAGLGVPVHVSSGYRCPLLNQDIGGELKSRHIRALAGDIEAPAFGTPIQVCRRVAELVGPDGQPLALYQVIHEYKAWCHVGIPDLWEEPKRELLSKFTGRPYLPGLLDEAPAA